MIGPIGQLVAVTRNAFIEAIRQPFYVVWIGIVTFGLILTPYLSAYTFEGTDIVLAADMSMSMLLVGGLLLAAFTAAGVVSREIENKTALTVISKPLPRPIFVLGKFFGVVGACVIAWYAWSLVAILALRQGTFSTVRVPWDFPVLLFGGGAILAAVVAAGVANYVFNKHFGASFSRWLAALLTVAVLAAMPFDHAFGLHSPAETFDATHVMGMLLVLQGVILFCAVAVACSTRLSTVPTLVICLSLFFAGVTSDYFFGRAAARGEWWGRTFYSALPNLQYLSLSDAMAMGTAGAVGVANYLVPVTLYMSLLTVAFLALAVALFQTRQTA